VPDKRPTFLASLSKSAHRLGARGPGEVLGLARARIVEAIRSDDVLRFFTRDTVDTTFPTSDGLTFKRATPEDADRFARDIGTDTASTFRARLSDRTRCYLVFEGDTILHSSWVTKAAAWTRELRAYVQPPLGDAYIYESFTRAQARGRGIYPFALRSIVADLAGDDTKHAWVAAEADNPASIKAITKAGFEEAFTIAYRRRFGRLIIDRATGPMASMAARFVTKGPVV
jgi:ribosomal protein S18 acetylase RimI-like enzyme